MDPALHSALGFVPLFGTASYGSNVFTAIVVLTIMILPIIASISRELFLGVPAELKEAALGLGTTRWEMVRGVVFPTRVAAVAAAMILGLGRAIGEAIAVAPGDRRRSRASAEPLQPRETRSPRGSPQNTRACHDRSRPRRSSISRLILLVFSLIVNLLAQYIVRRAARAREVAR